MTSALIPPFTATSPRRKSVAWWTSQGANAVSPPGAYSVLADLQGVRVATSYPGLVGAFLERNGVSAKLVVSA